MRFIEQKNVKTKSQIKRFLNFYNRSHVISYRMYIFEMAEYTIIRTENNVEKKNYNRFIIMLCTVILYSRNEIIAVQK